MGVWYCTAEDVKSALDFKETARNDGQIARAIEAASRDAESLTHRKFYPIITTRFFPWPTLSFSRPWRLWLEDSEVISVTSLTSGGVVIPSSNYFLEPVNDGPPFTHIEIKLSTSSAFGGGSTHQRDIAVAGVFGYRDDSSAAGQLAAAITTTTTNLVDITDASLVGVGDTIRVDDERFTVLAKQNRTSGQTLGVSLTSAKNGVGVSVSDGTQFHIGEIITIDQERMRIVDIAGNTLTVIRSWDGTVLAAHGSGTTIFVLGWRLQVERGVLGTTATTHLTATPITKWLPPALVRSFTVAQAEDAVLQESSGYAREIGSSGEGSSSVRDPSGKALIGLRERLYDSHARKGRKLAV